uniref:Uncharacterized protein n=1 Tax=Chromera velia CCMP2878 TaxID=1169474 RepID=A0A0G4G8A1_9ALVE|eukprot:Cvel_20724.t1-p1 / transcript=Cvel_20724.t1 / gene=Cvel_20724 / organism=Chromera_velia_CCMP2878 / gene_product=hypothetical protein / transcript_product=hypothetical protein / location=Cvel_scaffold1886:28732-29979(-) / protein_length=211 / sequence_SO=supercontig / SO=protein_coding / is_pseudo=false
MTLASRCSMTLSSEEAARYVQDGLPQLLASTLYNGMKADYNKYEELIKAIKEEIDEHGEDSFARWESEGERTERETYLQQQKRVREKREVRVRADDDEPALIWQMVRDSHKQSNAMLTQTPSTFTHPQNSAWIQHSQTAAQQPIDLFLESWMTTVNERMSSRQDGERGKRNVNLRWHSDTCASHTVWCRDTIDQDRILWEVPVEVTMGVTD